MMARAMADDEVDPVEILRKMACDPGGYIDDLAVDVRVNLTDAEVAFLLALRPEGW